MATAPNLISLDEYMRTSYSPDCEYVDGVILERNAGQGKHAYTQSQVLVRLSERLGGKKLLTLVAQRVRVSATRVRVPDVCVIEELEEVIGKPPLLCVEVLSPDDRWSRVNASVSDYQEMGVQCIWVIDPYKSRAWVFECENPPVEVLDGRISSQALRIELNLADLLP
ncbi:MAG: Uma2 family endonuclease [Acidobacteriaceae bacterium]|nr:Uma2 family endonuclease [Acidobacteriaceae bacterium]MBV9297141.1 Uma2 family endonuclease [Acidobacteriaceae bacterium]MBV9767781.1 Uma2 family endonuclease [Acidobacteriaceae bacterium]